MKKTILCMIGLALLMTGCQKNDQSLADTDNSNTDNISIEEVSVHPTPDSGFVGDPMPYFDGKEMNIFFLEDQRLGTQGYHPWSLYKTSDFYNFDFKGEVIPYSTSITDQDIALGTGSVIKDKNGIYHAFYTGHNDTYSPKEAIMHATSIDLEKWEKHEKDTFYADEVYTADDFRDPYVFYNENEDTYWMLVTTRKNNMGVIALYKSSDLTTWENDSVLFENDMGSDANLECPTLIEFNGYWYLTFSDQWPDRSVHYRIAKSPEGPFEKPEREILDGNGFYAGRMEKMNDKMFLIGWNATKDGHLDENNYNWAGNLVCHQVVQKENGLLSPMLIQSIDEKMNHNMKVDAMRHTDSVVQKGKAFSFSAASYEAVTYPKIEGSTKITGKIKINDKTDAFGFTFNVGEDQVGTINFVMNKPEGYISFYNMRTDTINSEEAQSKVKYSFNEGDEINFSILIDNMVATLYVNNEIALTARMYSVNNNEWAFFSKGSNVTLEDVEVYK